jgi:hypothetical protein
MLQDTRKSGLTGRTAASLGGRERQQWAVHVIRHQGRKPEIRCKCEIGKVARRKQTLRYPPNFFVMQTAEMSGQTSRTRITNATLGLFCGSVEEITPDQANILLQSREGNHSNPSNQTKDTN